MRSCHHEKYYTIFSVTHTNVCVANGEVLYVSIKQEILKKL